MSRERDFSNYELGDNVYQLAAGLIPKIAGRLGVDIGDEPSSEALGRLVGILGPNKVLRENVEVTAIDNRMAANFVERSGVQLPLARSLWTSEIEVPTEDAAYALTGAVANWQDRAARLLIRQQEAGSNIGKVYIPVGNEVMKSVTEVVNPNVQDFMALYHEQYPTQSQYVEWHVEPLLSKAGFMVDILPYETTSGSEITANFVRERPELFESGRKLIAARVANAGILLAAEIRRAARLADPGYDADRHDPQLFILTDTFAVAHTEKQKAQPTRYQAPHTALRQVAVTAKMLHTAAAA